MPVASGNGASLITVRSSSGASLLAALDVRLEPADRLLMMNVDASLDESEDPQHTAGERAAAASRSTWVSVAVNLLLTLTQVAVGLVSKSQGLVADGIHSLSDLVADFVVLFAGHHAQKEPDADHPYGHQRYETAASLALGALLLAVGVGMLWSAVRKLGSPETIQQVHIVALYVAAAALVAKECLSDTCCRSRNG